MSPSFIRTFAPVLSNTNHKDFKASKGPRTKDFKASKGPRTKDFKASKGPRTKDFTASKGPLRSYEPAH